MRFQSTLPARGETNYFKPVQIFLLFQSTLPARGETKSANYDEFLVIFQSTLPARGETLQILDNPIDYRISIHSPRTGRDRLYKYL